MAFAQGKVPVSHRKDKGTEFDWECGIAVLFLPAGGFVMVRKEIARKPGL